MNDSRRNREQCPICGSSKLAICYSEQGRPVLTCEVCRHLFFGEIPTEDDLAQYYGNAYAMHHDQLCIQTHNLEYYNAHFHELQAYANATGPLSILDYGCSYPIFLEVAKGLGAKVTGCDFSAVAMEYGRRVGVPVIHPSEVSSHDESYDVIRFSHTLEHLVDPRDVLKGTLQRLNPGGIIYITQPSFPVLKYGELEVKLRDAVYPSHLHFFSPLSVLTLAGVLGLQVVRLFTHQNESANFAQYGPCTDYEASSMRLSAISACGDPIFGFLNNYPHYMGNNIAVVMKWPVA